MAENSPGGRREGAAPERKRRRRLQAVLGSAAVLILLAALPNLSSSVAYALSGVPVLGGLFHVVTFRNYSYSDEYHEADVDVAIVSADASDPSLRDAVASVNEDVQALTDKLVGQFKQESASLGPQAHTALSVSYDVVTNTSAWFTLRVTIWQGAGSSDTQVKYYHIDKTTGRVCTLSDLFADGRYTDAISAEIVQQMRERMAADSSVIYWVGSYAEAGSHFEGIKPDQNFYFAEDGNLVISFDKYEVGPGSMGCPTFEIDQKIYEDDLK